MSIKTEPFQRTDISVQPLGFNLQLFRVQILNVFYRVPLAPLKIKKIVQKKDPMFTSRKRIRIQNFGGFSSNPSGPLFSKNSSQSCDPAHANSVRR